MQEDRTLCLAHQYWARAFGRLLQDLRVRPVNNWLPQDRRNTDQLCLSAVRTDEVACRLLRKAASLEAVAEVRDLKTVMVSYTRR